MIDSIFYWCVVFNFQLQLYARLVATVDSEHFLARLKSLQQASVNGISYEFPFKEATGILVYFMGLKTSMPHPIYTISDTILIFHWFLGFVLWLDADLRSAEILIKVDGEDPSWWVWVTDEMVPSNVEEWSGIDDEKYVVVSEEHVVDGVANFMARCIMSNPKAQVNGNQSLFLFNYLIYCI